ncbi:aldehyde dehydrogenase family protein [Leucobacter chinensis]|uniref:aldehyde dehydrogenase family protein n=1 Tax=Leucobacter chinensis TaxID=2851010 RepID=UPI001C2421DF|nr:aldehyde dehydrogenase family protein [Leucobacter chinensis]
MNDQRPIQVHVNALRNTFRDGVTRPLSWREGQLRALDRMLVECEAEIEQALFADLGKSPVESQVAEIGFLRTEIAYALKHLRSWAASSRVSVPAVVMPATAWITPEPLGTVLVIAPWNYPLMLALSPVIGAIAAGNCVVVKPSELAPNTSSVIAERLVTYLDVRAVRVIEGGVEETTELLEHRFNHIFYTGNGRVGRIIARAAAEHLTPTTLELGGKSPLYIDESVPLAAAAKRIVWAKFMNAGQTCVAPDYVLGSRETLAALEPHLARAVELMYGTAIHDNPDFGRIVSERHCERLIDFLGDGRVVTGGSYRLSDRFIAPTVLADVPRDAPVMREEIFGPILPLIEVSDLSDAIDLVNEGDSPLSAYVFSTDPETRKRWETETSSGALTFGAPVLHLTVPELPFGGVGESGMGAYHGKRSFDLMSHAKPVLSKPLKPDTLGPTIMPPFTEAKERIVRDVLGKLR